MLHSKNESQERGHQYLRPTLGAAFIILIIVVAIVVAYVGGGANIRTSPEVVMLTPQQPPSLSLAKEYIYAGDRFARLMRQVDGQLLPRMARFDS